MRPHFTTPPDVTKCWNFRTDGPTPCYHPDCKCFADWDKPRGCHCNIYSDRCFEQCEPPLREYDDRRTSLGQAALVLSFLALIFLFMWAISPKPAHSADADPYSCYGGGRYEAMSEGAPSCNEMPRSCAIIRRLPRDCASAKLIVKLWGKDKAESRARACGALDTDIAAAKRCDTDSKLP